MLLFDAVLPRMPIGAEALLEAGLMAGVLLPIIFFLVFRPFAQHVADLEEAQAALRGAYDDLERRVQERTTEIRRRNRELSVLYSIDRATAQSLDLAEILNDALDKVLEVLEVEAGGIFPRKCISRSMSGCIPPFSSWRACYANNGPSYLSC